MTPAEGTQSRPGLTEAEELELLELELEASQQQASQQRQTHVHRRRAARSDNNFAGNTGFTIPLNETTLPAIGMGMADVMTLGQANPIAGVEHGIGAKLSQFAAGLGIDTENGEGLFDAAARAIDLDTTNDETFGEAYSRGYQRRADMSSDAYDANPIAYEAGRLIPEIAGANVLNNALREPFEKGLSHIGTRGGRYLTRLLGNTAGDVLTIAGSNALSGGAREGEDIYTDSEGAVERFEETAKNPFVLGTRTALSAANRGGIATKSLAGPSEFRVTPDRVAAAQAQGGRSIAMSQTGDAANEMLPMLSGERITQDSVKTFRFVNNALRNVLKDSGLSGDDISARTARVFNRLKDVVPSAADGRTTFAQLIERSFAQEFPELGNDFAQRVRTFLLGTGLKDTGSTARTIQQMRESQIDDYNTLIDETFGTTKPGVEEQTVKAEIARLSRERQKHLKAASSNPELADDADQLRQVVMASEDAGGIDFRARGYNSLEEFVSDDPFTAGNDLSVYLNDQMGRAAGDARAYTAIRREHGMLEPLLARVPNWRQLTTDLEQQMLVRENLGYIDGFGQKQTGFGTDFRKAARDPDMPERMVDYQVGRYEGTNPRQANALQRIENSQVQIDGQRFNRRELAQLEQQRAARASLGETVRAPLNRSRPGGTNAEGQDIVGLNMSQMQREGDLVAMQRLLGEDGTRFAEGVDNIVDQRQFLADIDPRTGSNTVNKANAQVDGDSVMTGLPRQLTSNAGPANITDALLLASGMPPVNFLARVAPQTMQRVFGPGRRTRQEIANALLQRPNLAPPRTPRPNALDALPQRSGRNQRRRGTPPAQAGVGTVGTLSTVAGGAGGALLGATESPEASATGAFSGAIAGNVLGKLLSRGRGGAPVRGQAPSQAEVLQDALAEAERATSYTKQLMESAALRGDLRQQTALFRRLQEEQAVLDQVKSQIGQSSPPAPTGGTPPAQGGVPPMGSALNELATSIGNRRLGVGQERMLPMTNPRRQQHAMREAGVRLVPGRRPIENARDPRSLAEAMEQAAQPIVRRDRDGFAYVERGPAGELMDQAIEAIQLRQSAVQRGHQDTVRRYREGLQRIAADRDAARGNITATARARAEVHRLVNSLGFDQETAQRLTRLHDAQFQQGKPLRASTLPAPELNAADQAIAGTRQRQARDLASDMIAGREREYKRGRVRQDPDFVRTMLDPRRSGEAASILSGSRLMDPRTAGMLELGAGTAAVGGVVGAGAVALNDWRPEIDRRTDTPVPTNALPSPIEPKGSDSVAGVQLLLRNSGYDPGPIDGVMGANTAIAIAQAEAALGMPITGKWSDELEVRLRSPVTEKSAQQSMPMRPRQLPQ